MRSKGGKSKGKGRYFPSQHKKLRNSNSVFSGCQNETLAVALHGNLHATRSDKQDLASENRNLRAMVKSQLDMVTHLEEEIERKDLIISNLEKDTDKLKLRLDCREHRMCLFRQPCNNRAKPVVSVTTPTPMMAPVLATRYFGRRSKTVPSRALKRRYLGPPKVVPAQVILRSPSTSSTPSEQPPSQILVKFTKKVGRPKKIIQKVDFLTTDRAYYLPDVKPRLPPAPISSSIYVPSWRLRLVTSFYQMEGTENTDAWVFERRHSKFELSERRRKRWDLQRIREQRAKDLLKKKQERANALQQKPHSFFPDPSRFEWIQVVEQLPVLAFGTSIPLFPPSEFSLPWVCNDTTSRGRKTRLSVF